MKGVDWYLNTVVKGGDEMSALLEERFAPTLRNSLYAEVIHEGMNGTKIILPPHGKLAVVHSCGGDHTKTDAREYAHSVVDRLVRAAEEIGAEPIAFANVIDASTSDKDAVLPYADALAERANHYKLVVPNGEFAVLGNRVTVSANISATMLSFVSREANLPWDSVTGFFKKNDVLYAVFDPEGKALYMNSDGNGTKPEFAERNGEYYDSRYDSLAMKLDDLIKLGASAHVVSDVVETNRELERVPAALYGAYINDESRFIHILQPEFVGNRIRSYKEGIFAFNMSGSAVSTIDEQRLQNPLKPRAGEYLIAIRGKPNPRSNGITDKRAIMQELFGLEWHTTPEGRMFMPFLSAPSTVFYGAFSKLINNGLASSIYHMSGGAFKGKLAKPLANHGLYAEIHGLFPADWRELALAGARLTPAEIAYAKWPMGNEGFAATSRPDDAIALLREHGLQGRIVGQLQALNGMTGIRLMGIKSSSNEPVYYSGR